MGQCGTSAPRENNVSSKYAQVQDITPNDKKKTYDPLAPVLKERILLCLSCNDLIKTDITSDSDPFVVLYLKSSPTTPFKEVGRTEVIYDNHYPTFATQFELDYFFEEQQILRFDVYDEDEKGSKRLRDHDILGSCTMKVGEIVHEQGMTLGKKLMHRGRALKNKKTQRYSHLVAMAERIPDQTGQNTGQPQRGHGSFLEYMQGDVDMSLMVAIDFTGSNGDPRDYQSLHYINGDTPSKYQYAVRQIGNILSSYDTDQKYPVWGFGGRFNNVLVEGKEHWNGIKHDFNLNLRAHDPEVAGIYGIEESYLHVIRQNVVQLSGPTLFQPVLQKAKAIASVGHNQVMTDKENNAIQYFILLIITDGVINDMKFTKDLIVDIANEYLPLSIILVGVGDANFNMMEELDGDDHGLMNSRGQYGKRDVVQFVPMNRFQNISDLSRETLFEIPKQFLSYVEKHNIKPKMKAATDMQVIGNQFMLNQNDDDDDDDDDKSAHELASAPAKEALPSMWDNAPLPPGWERSYDEDGRIYYVDNRNQITSWTHPSAT